MSVAGLFLCRCLKALVLQRIIKMPNSWERDPNLSRREREKKNTIFLYFPWDAGAQRDENFAVLGVTQSENEDLAFCRASKARWLYIYIWNGQQKAHAKNKLLFLKNRFFLNVWIYIWDGSLVGLQGQGMGLCVCVCCTWQGRGAPSSWVAMTIIGFYFPPYQNCIFIHRWLPPPLTVHDQISEPLQKHPLWLIFTSCQRNRVNLLRGLIF